MSGGDAGRQLRDRIRAALRAKEWQEASTLTDQWCRACPDHAVGWYWRAGALLGLGRLAEALGCARRAQNLEANNERFDQLVAHLEKRLQQPRRQSAATQMMPAAEAGAAGQAEPEATQMMPAAEAGAAGQPEPEATLVDAVSESPRPVEPPRETVQVAGHDAVEPTLAEDAGDLAAAAAGSHTRPAAAPPVAVTRPAGGDAGPTDTVMMASGAVPPTLADEAEAARERQQPEAAAVPAAATQRLWAEGAVVEGRYEVRDVARGGMGEVYFVFDRELGLMIAVKTPLPAALASEAGRARFLREAEAWIGLGLHPNICSAYYVREIGGLPRLFIEYVEGGSLEEWLKQGRVTTAAQALDLAIQIAAGMQHAHSFTWQDEDGVEHAGVVHRDLKPANVLLTRDCLARVTDFGLVGRGGGLGEEEPGSAEGIEVEATLVDVADSARGGVWGTMTVGGVAIGTPPYMPPEQWDGAHHADRPADVYAFGCLLYELFCGRRPFVISEAVRKARPEVVRYAWEKLHREQAPADPSSLAPKIDAELANLLLRCLDKQPGRRPAGFAELGEELKAIYLRVTGRGYPRPEPRESRLLADSLNNRGVSFATLGQIQRGERAWRQALEADPQHLEATYNAALFDWRCRSATDDDVAARMERVRQGQLQAWRHEHLCGKVHLLLGRYQQALERLRAAAASAQQVPDVVKDCAFAVAAAAQESATPEAWQEAAAVLAGATGTASADPVALTANAVALFQLGQLDAAQSCYDQARRLMPSLPDDLQRAAQRLIPGMQVVQRVTTFAGRATAPSLDESGSVVVMCGEDDRFMVLDLYGDKKVRTLRNPTGASVRSVAVDAAGKRAMVVGEGEPVCVWDLATGDIKRKLKMHSGFLNSMATSPGCRRLAALGSDGVLSVWDVDTGERILGLKVHAGFGLCVAIASDHRTVISGGRDAALRITDVDQGAVLVGLEGHQAPVTAVSVNGEHQRALSGDETGELRLWDLKMGECLAVLHGHAGPIRCVLLADDGYRALSGSSDGGLRLWDLRTQQPVIAYSFTGLSGGACLADWSSVVITHGNSVSQMQLMQTPQYHPSWAVAIPVSVAVAEERDTEFEARLEAARELLASEDHAGAQRMIEQARSIPGYEHSSEALEITARLGALFGHRGLAGAWEERVFSEHGDRVLAVALTPDGSQALSAGADRRLLLWRTEDGEIVHDLPTQDEMVVALAITPDGRHAASVSLGNILQLWDLATGSVVRSTTAHDVRVNAVALDAAGRRVITASADETLRVWELPTLRCLHVLEGHLAQVLAVAPGAGGHTAVSGGENGSVVVWDLETGESLRALEGFGSAVFDLACSGDGRWVLAGGRDSTAVLWSLATGRVAMRFEHPASRVTAVAFSPSCEYVLTGANDGIVRLWQRGSSECLRQLRGHSAAVTWVGMSADGQRVISASADATVRPWYLDWEPQIRPFADWDEGARPFLELFLARRTQGDPAAADAPRPRWSRAELDVLLADLGNRGFGWLRAEGVERQLRRMSGAAAAPGSSTATQLRATRRTTVAVTPQQRKRRKVLTRLAICCAIALIPLAMVGQRIIARGQLRVNEDQVAASRAELTRGMMPLESLTRGIVCERDQLPAYLDAFLSGGSIGADPYAAACLVKLGNAMTVEPLLDGVRSSNGKPPRVKPDQVRAILCHMDETTVPKQAEALSDEDPTVRAVAASALLARGSEGSVQAVVGRARDSERGVRRTVSAHLRGIVSSGRIDTEEAMDLAEMWAIDADPEVRRNVALGLRVFAGSRQQALLHELAADSDPEVQNAASRTLAGS